jgi:hypothetical protein
MRATKLFAFIGIVGLIGFAFLLGSGRLSLFAPAAANTLTNFTSAVVVQRIQHLNQLATTKYTMQLVVGKGQDGYIFGFGQDKILLVAQGKVVAGIDLSQLAERDAHISDDRKTITVNLPPAKIMDYYLDEKHTFVYQRDTGIWPPPDPQLETAARQQASEQILSAACEAGIMKESADDAKQAVEQLLTVFGFQQVTVTSAQDAQCVAPSS